MLKNWKALKVQATYLSLAYNKVSMELSNLLSQKENPKITIQTLDLNMVPYLELVL